MLTNPYTQCDHITKQKVNIKGRLKHRICDVTRGGFHKPIYATSLASSCALGYTFRLKKASQKLAQSVKWLCAKLLAIIKSIPDCNNRFLRIHKLVRLKKIEPIRSVWPTNSTEIGSNRLIPESRIYSAKSWVNWIF